MTQTHRGSPDWNVVATVHEGEFRAAAALLRRLGEVSTTDFHNVLVMRVEDPVAFVDALAARVDAEPGLMNILSRVVPATATFAFQTPEEFEARARGAALQLAPALAGRRFHARVHRRGFRHRISGHEEEQRLDHAIIEALAAAGTPAFIAFEDPDAVVVVETVGQRAGASLWTRDQMRRYPFIRLD